MSDFYKKNDIYLVINRSKEYSSDAIVGKPCKIIASNGEYKNEYVGVEFFFKIPAGHSCEGQGAEERCYYIEKNCLKKIEKIIDFNQ